MKILANCFVKILFYVGEYDPKNTASKFISIFLKNIFIF